MRPFHLLEWSRKRSNHNTIWASIHSIFSVWFFCFPFPSFDFLCLWYVWFVVWYVMWLWERERESVCVGFVFPVMLVIGSMLMLKFVWWRMVIYLSEGTMTIPLFLISLFLFLNFKWRWEMISMPFSFYEIYQMKNRKLGFFFFLFSLTQS